LKPFTDSPIRFVFLACLLYWAYLLFASSPGKTMDAFGYIKRGKIVYEHGLSGYIQQGPDKEPLFPIMIASSLHLADKLPIPFEHIQRVFQLLFLFLAQFLLYKILVHLRIHETVILFLTAYFGFSPALLNAALSFFTEVLTFPITLGLLLTSLYALEQINTPSLKRTVLHGVILGIILSVGICVKYTFIILTLILLLVFTMLMLKALFQKNNRVALHLFILMMCFSTLLFSFDAFYKGLNKKYNGSHIFTEGGARSLYGGVKMRTKDMSASDYVTALSTVPGINFCYSLFSQEKCNLWTFLEADNLGAWERNHLEAQGLSKEGIEKHLTRSSWEMIQMKPLQFFILHNLEFLKNFFWESTKIGFVEYPVWLTRLYDSALFKNPLRLFWGVLSFAGYVYAWVLMCTRRKDNDSGRFYASLLIVLMVTTIGSLYALFAVLTRYSFTIAPLEMIAIGLLLDRIWKGRLLKAPMKGDRHA
jgi:hypothetical protein